MSDAESEAYRWQKEFEERLDELKNYIGEDEQNDEYITCSAVWYDDNVEHVHQPINIKTGFVVAGHRHHNCFNTMFILSNDIKKHTKFEKEQGFLTNLNRFVDRIWFRGLMMFELTVL